jgi:hypothetical protein
VKSKQRLFAQTGAAVVDMESLVVAKLAACSGLPFATVRVVSDAADRALPPAALAGLSSNGRPDLAAVLRSLAAQPRQLLRLIQVADDAAHAFRVLDNLPRRWLVSSLGHSSAP